MNIQVVALNCLAHHAVAAQSEPWVYQHHLPPPPTKVRDKPWDWANHGMNNAETGNTARAKMYGANVHGHMFGTVGTGRPRGEHPSQCVLETCDG